MLAVLIDSPSGRLGTTLSALIVISCVIGLTMHKDFYAGRQRKDFFCFYTNISNLLVLVYFALAAPRLYARSSLHSLIPAVEFSVMMSIMLTFCVFHLLLFPAVRLQVMHTQRNRCFYIVLTDNLFIHYLVPLLVFAYWLLCSPGKEFLRPVHAFLWTLFPVTFIAFSFFRARFGRIIEETGTPYPYPFLDVHTLGIRTVFQFCAKLYALCLFAGLILVFVFRIPAFLSHFA